MQIILGYLAVCPTQGRHFASTLLTRRKIYSDNQAFQIAESLTQLGNEAESVQVYLTRAQYWLRQAHPLYGSNAYVKAILAPHKDVVDNALKREAADGHVSTLSKGIYFLQLAHDLPYVDALVDRCVYRVMCAVTACKPLFAQLVMCPMAPVPNNSESFVYRPDVPPKKAARVFTQEEGEIVTLFRCFACTYDVCFSSLSRGGADFELGVRAARGV